MSVYRCLADEGARRPFIWTKFNSLNTIIIITHLTKQIICHSLLEYKEGEKREREHPIISLWSFILFLISSFFSPSPSSSFHLKLKLLSNIAVVTNSIILWINFTLTQFSIIKKDFILIRFSFNFVANFNHLL